MHVFLFLLFVRTFSKCTTNMNCSLNGVCNIETGLCSCDSPWSGTSCEKLLLKPAPMGGIYGFNGAFNVTSWGGNIIQSDSMWHLFVTDIGGKGCGLHAWQNQSRVVHATSKNVYGPYTKQSIAVAHQAHNPQAIIFNESWYIFHIGSGNSMNKLHDCNEPHITPNLSNPMNTTPGSQIHKSIHPGGPFSPVQAGGWNGCNNPSPFVAPNGTLFVVCTWSIRHAPKPEGPWSKPIPLHPPNKKDRHWEDPFLFIDKRDNFHILSHTYSMLPYPSNAISGHAYSPDGINWIFSDVEPYGNVITRIDGTKQSFATLERPKLVFADKSDPHTPTHLINGVSPVWQNGSDPCIKCGHCSACKVACKTRGDAVDLDWTYTLMQPLGN